MVIDNDLPNYDPPTSIGVPRDSSMVVNIYNDFNQDSMLSTVQSSRFDSSLITEGTVQRKIPWKNCVSELIGRFWHSGVQEIQQIE